MLHFCQHVINGSDQLANLVFGLELDTRVKLPCSNGFSRFFHFLEGLHNHLGKEASQEQKGTQRHTQQHHIELTHPHRTSSHMIST